MGHRVPRVLARYGVAVYDYGILYVGPLRWTAQHDHARRVARPSSASDHRRSSQARHTSPHTAQPRANPQRGWRKQVRVCIEVPSRPVFGLETNTILLFRAHAPHITASEQTPSPSRAATAHGEGTAPWHSLPQTLQQAGARILDRA